MSIKLIDAVLDSPLRSSDRLVMIALCDAGNDEGFCYPGYKTLIRRSGCSRSTVADTLKRLKGVGLIEVTPHAQIGTGRKVNTYQLNIELLKSPDLSNILTYHCSPNVKPKSTVAELPKRANTISTGAELRKVREPDSISTAPEHEPSVRTVSKEPSVKDMSLPKKKTSTRFQKPAVQEVADYFREKCHPHPEAIADKFMCHYESNGWKVGKNPMRSWKAAVAGTWMNGCSNQQKSFVETHTGKNWDQGLNANAGFAEQHSDRSWAVGM